jgi:hypothetical protein
MVFAVATSAASPSAQAQTLIDVWDSTNANDYQLIGQVQTIQSAQSGMAHYDYFSASGHPECVNLDRRNANIWMHENTAGGDLTFGFIFSEQVSVADISNTAKVDFRIVDSSGNPYVSQSDDPGEAVETPPGSNAFVGNFRYNTIYTDGIAVSGIGGPEWTVIINSVNFGNITNWYTAGGGTSNGTTCTENLGDIPLTIGSEYRLTPAGNPPSGAPVDALEVFADAGDDQSVNEEQFVTLDGNDSNPDTGTISYSWTQVSGTAVSLSDATAGQPTFTAPTVAPGGETLTFELTYEVDGENDTDSVDITVVNVNHTPVADAGDDDSIAEGSPVSLDGTDSFDSDNDAITYSWVQVSGSPTVVLGGATTATPTFTAPLGASGGAPGIVATLVFELTVDDGFPADAPSPGYTFDDVSDTVTIEITNVNNDPVANAGVDQTVNENSDVDLNGNASSDPDSDNLTYAWTQTGGPSVLLASDNTATPSFTTPFVSSGGDALTFELTVDDGYGGTSTDEVVINVQNENDPPDASLAQPSRDCLWPPNHKLLAISINGVSDPDDNATITIDSVTQDEVTNGLGDGDTAGDAVINDDGTVLLRAERSGTGDGRVYHINFTASDIEGSDSGSVEVCVRHNKKRDAVDGGALYDSTQ